MGHSFFNVAANQCYLALGRRSRKQEIASVLFGGRLPFILRPAGDSEWMLVGDAYSHHKFL